jgi:hypothetical protein
MGGGRDHLARRAPRCVPPRLRRFSQSLTRVRTLGIIESDLWQHLSRVGRLFWVRSTLRPCVRRTNTC